MKASELRISNLVLDHDGNVDQIEGTFSSGTIRLLNYGAISITHIKPILLSEDWLLKAGFEKDEDGVYKMKNVLYWIDRCYNSNTGVLQIASGYAAVINAPCQYVHELQNLYFCLFGEELTFKM